MSSAIFHSGELAIQNRLGVAERMDKFGRMVIRDHMPLQHQEFYQQLPMIFAGFSDLEGNVWASVLTGKPGFVQTPDAKRMNLALTPMQGDPFSDFLHSDQGSSSAEPAVRPRIGLLGIDLSNRRRNRLSAEIMDVADQQLALSVVQSFGNCPQYIQTRVLEYQPDTESTDANPSAAQAPVHHFESFSADIRRFITQSDTFFVASSTQQHNEFTDDSTGADVSHRGGRAGFIRVDNASTLTIPDYTGNNHFNTLGNIEINPHVGLLFIDFHSGDIYSMTGTAEILWDDPETESFEGAERLWRFHLKRGLILKQAMPWRFQFQEWSPNSLMTDTWEDMAQRQALESEANRWHPVRILKTEIETPDIKSFYLSFGDGAQPSFKAGQFITIRVPIEGQYHTRTYSLSSAPLDNFLRISVKRDGLVSNWLHDTLTPGSALDAKLPIGGFTLQASDAPAVLISAGVGITPMVSMLRQTIKESFRARTSKPVLMINTFRHSSDQAFFKEVNTLIQQSGDDTRALWLLTQAGKDDQPGRDYSADGRLNREMLQHLLPIGRYDFYLCGPAGFMQDVYDLLIELGVPDLSIHAESFGPASLKRTASQELTGTEIAQPKIVEPAAATHAVVEFSSSQVEQAWSETDGNLLEFAESHGLEPEFGCRGGSCGTCKVKVLTGTVTHQGKATFPLEEDEALLCCAVPADNGSEIQRIKVTA